MRYGLIANPVSGTIGLYRKREILAHVSKILDSEIHGLDTVSAEDFALCAEDLASKCDVMVVAGGDGTFSDIINAIDTADIAVAFIPLGTGNAMRHALKYKGGIGDIAKRIIKGKLCQYDLIDCDNKKLAFMASVGIEGTIIDLHDKYVAEGRGGFKTYPIAFLKAYFETYEPAIAEITIDGKTVRVHDLLSMMVVKQPFYGFGMTMVPGAAFDDGLLHTLTVTKGLLRSLYGILTAFTVGNRVGHYETGREICLKLERKLSLQIDGNSAWESDTFNFRVRPKALKIMC